MPVSTLVATAGATNANAYCTLTFADQYHLDRPAVGTTWSAATNDQKNAAILWATVLMDTEWEWEGYVVDEDQALLFPRYEIPDNKGLGTFIDETSIPIQLQRATAEYARQLLASDLAGNSDIETLGITKLKAGPVEFAFKEEQSAKPVPDIVVALIPSTWGSVKGSHSSGTRDLLRA